MTYLIFAANWGFAALNAWQNVLAVFVLVSIGICIGVGFIWSVSHPKKTYADEPQRRQMAELQRIAEETGLVANPHVRSNSNVFYSDGYPLAERKAWGDVPYAELEQMFLDQFLLRYFSGLMPKGFDNDASWKTCEGESPWDYFVALNPWFKEMPTLFRQMTGYKLNDHQLSNAIVEYSRRLQKLSRKSMV